MKWTGNALRLAREERGMSVEELAQKTRIRKTIILAIENEHFTYLPAPVYLAGLLTQIARELRLTPDEVAREFLERYRSM